MSKIVNINKKKTHQFCGFYWIRNSGVPYFKWFSTDYFESKWNQEDLFFSGFFSAINSSGEVFFEGDVLKYVEFRNYKIFCDRIKNNDIFALITLKECSNDLAQLLLNKMLKFYYDTKLTKEELVRPAAGKVESKFLQFFDEVINSYDNKIKINLHNKFLSLSNKKNEIKISKKLKKIKKAVILKNLEKIKKRNSELELKLRSMSLLGRTTGHTLNNALSAILGNVTLAKLDVSEDDELYELLDDAESACTRTQELTSQLLTFSKIITEKNFDKLKTTESKKLIKRDFKLEKKSIVTGKGRILIMDDERPILETVKKMLIRLGYTADLAYNLNKSIKMYKESLNNNEKYDAVILDLSEMGGTGEFGALLWLKMDPKINIIVSSGYAEDPIFSSYKKHGFKGVLKKPYDISKLSWVLNRILKN